MSDTPSPNIKRKRSPEQTKLVDYFHAKGQVSESPSSLASVSPPAKKLNMAPEEVDTQKTPTSVPVPTPDKERMQPVSIDPATLRFLEAMEKRLSDKLVDTVTQTERRLNESMKENMKRTVKETIKESVKSNMRETIDEKLMPMQADIKKLLTAKEDTEALVSSVNTLTEETKKIERKCTKIELENEKLKERLKDIETKLLDSSITIHGMPENKWEEDPERCELVRYVLSTALPGTTDEKILAASKIQIRSTERLGRYNSSKGRPISVTFQNKQDADYLIENKRKLDKGVFVDRVYCAEVERERKFLRPILREARKIPAYQGKCKMEGDVLEINSKKYTRDNLHELPYDLSGYKCTSKQDENTLGFFGELNPFSNFHPCKFTHAGITFTSSEQFIQYTKSMLFNDTRNAAKILGSNEALSIKELGRKVENFNMKVWLKEAKELCTPGIAAKFEQNEWLKKMLLETGDRVLVESSHDKDWGTGIPLHEEDCLVKTKWVDGQGILGEILENIRKSLRCCPQPNEATPMESDVSINNHYRK